MSSSPDIQYIKGVGPSKARLFNKLGIFSIEDLLTLYPRGYMDLSNPTPIFEAQLYEKAGLRCVVTKAPKLIKRFKGMEIYKGQIADSSGVCDIVFFNMKYQALALKVGVSYFFYGVVNGNLVNRELVNPYIEPCNGRESAGLVPLYPLTSGLSQNAVRKAVGEALKGEIPQDNLISERVAKEYNLVSHEFALKNIHRPADEKALEMARGRLVFEEMLVFNAGLSFLKKSGREKKGIRLGSVKIAPFTDALGFELTNAQKKAINECVSDMQSGYCMNRLIQGDVGCGKTAVAAAVIYLNAVNGHQSALMAPTEVLANQHYKDLIRLFEPLGIRICLLTGSMKASEKKGNRQLAASGQADLIIGTHALLSEGVEFSDLTLIVTDEQHRFGVEQRKILQSKGRSPHLLLMSATPIPRTLAMVLYAELNISVIDEMPPGRKKVLTYAVDDSKRERLYGFVKKQIEQGRQAYIICAKALDDEKSELVSVKELSEELQNGYLKGLNIAYIHGKMKQSDKDDIMTRFSAGEIQAIISTTVVEVGVNVPNATVMVIENAERFGLSTLHQLRGRVGRGSEQSYCILLSDSNGETALSRLSIMTKTNDGFEISRKDLEIRGPGEFFGQRQSGLVRFHIANLMTDMEIIAKSKECLDKILAEDELLRKKENLPLKQAVDSVIEKYIM